MLLATLREPPRRGSAREFALIMYSTMRDRIEHAKVRALAQAMIDKEEGVKAFDEYMKLAFPWHEDHKVKRDVDMKKIMAEEIKRGALLVTSDKPRVVQSKLKKLAVDAQDRNKIIRGQPIQQTHPNLYKNLGPVLPTTRHGR